MAMWKQQSSSAPAGSWPEQTYPGAPTFEPTAPSSMTRPGHQPGRGDHSVFTQGMTVRGEISGPDPVYVDGVIEGQINIPSERVTVGPHGMVAGTSEIPCITAREIVVLGVVRGNLVATDRLEIGSAGSVMGNVRTGRLKIEDGSYFQGSIEIHEPPQPEPAQAQDDADEFAPQPPRRDYAEAAY
ncbi:polymer-forming cytoskeletal protein [Acidobacteria bacterium AB60]|nr:polymer-forming cytoskeletal protein [Acidobacteria bacterium AB60]